MATAHPPLKSTAFTTIDLDKPGKQVGFVMIPHSPHGDAWGVTRIPIAVIANGTGPTVIFEGGNHGDEYEGPIAICEMIRDIDPGEIQGRLILMPATNVHAVIAGQRTSPVDGLNLNRTFPGNAGGTITQQIAAFMSAEIFPRGNAFVDLHSGGTSLHLIPSAVIEPVGDAEHRRRNIAAVRAFDAPLTVVISNLGDPRTATATAVRHGLTTLGTELSGGGSVSIEALDICRRGVRGLLTHFGVLEAEESQPLSGTRLCELPGTRAYVYATVDGIFEPFHQLGREVRAGEPAGRIHVTWDPTHEPETLTYQADGILYGTRQPGRVKPGNCCLVVAAPYTGALD
jgi:N2-acetyl-L-2,4-diaminobutanoate deacetylase